LIENKQWYILIVIKLGLQLIHHKPLSGGCV